MFFPLLPIVFAALALAGCAADGTFIDPGKATPADLCRNAEKALAASEKAGVDQETMQKIWGAQIELCADL